jgi:hypothetical protein
MIQVQRTGHSYVFVGIRWGGHIVVALPVDEDTPRRDEFLRYRTSAKPAATATFLIGFATERLANGDSHRI